MVRPFEVGREPVGEMTKPDRETGHTPLKLFELPDVHDDRLIAEISDELGALQAVRRPQHAMLIYYDYVCSRLLGHGAKDRINRRIIDKWQIPDDRAIR